MTEQELVKWYKSNIKEGLETVFEIVDSAETLEDLDKFRKRMKETSKELKVAIEMMYNYLSVNESINNATHEE